MRFEEQLLNIKNKAYLYTKFLIGIEALSYEKRLIPLYLDTNHTFERKYDNTFANAIYSYEDENLHIYHLEVLQHGMYSDDYTASIDKIESALNNEETNLENEFNEAKVNLNDYKLNNRDKTILFNFEFLGTMNDAFTIDDWGYYIYLELLKDNSENFWSFLLIQSEELKEEKRFDLAFLLIFSALENYLNLNIELLQNNYYKELNLEGMNLKLKYSFLLKDKLEVSTGDKEKHPCKDLIMKKFSELYKFRNSVAHGKERNITEQDCEECFDTFIFTYITINYKPKNNQELLNYIKKY
ncbi:hypothetical protein CPG37_02685 [Malaciobacter canalis]|uniref:MAE-28990/MAE-18760-like HEPN domain-containing protein n=1 Tax=Malaciobacter canalis TaxID=1912871 RepID=A0ABX4LS90_9BACT|nr:hypothetical protein [Malaciobacter canalis]PHO10767.1 hypothetical protein CPG37_02685 [Malaciobacter canalis]QEE33924.1 hypothetical protein ACAN_2486 [Malaciobacter canalis]